MIALIVSNGKVKATKDKDEVFQNGKFLLFSEQSIRSSRANVRIKDLEKLTAAVKNRLKNLANVLETLEEDPVEVSMTV